MTVPLLICCNGIFDDPANMDDWTADAVQRAQRDAHWLADAYRTEDRPGLFRGAFNAKHARGLVDFIHRFDPHGLFPLVLMAHSNGADIVARAVRDCGLAPLEVHLFAAACEPSIERDGFTGWLEGDPRRKLCLYCSKGDGALRLAHWSHKLFGWMGLGFGDLGREGPKGISEGVASQVYQFWSDGYGHSDWFAPTDHMDQTMQWVTGVVPATEPPIEGADET